MAEIDQATLDSLAAKLDSLELNADEQLVLDSMLSRAEAYEPEVEGFGRFSYSGLSSGADLSPMGFKLGRSSGLIGRAGVMTEMTTEIGTQRPPPP